MTPILIVVERDRIIVLPGIDALRFWKEWKP